MTALQRFRPPAGPVSRGRGAGLRAAAIAAAALLTLAGCAGGHGADTGNGPSAVQETSFPFVYAQEIAWEPCGQDFGFSANGAAHIAAEFADGDAFRCGWVEAPFDWSDPTNHDTIELAAIHIPATAAEPRGTLLGNPGGPGIGGIGYTLEMARAPGFDAVRQHYDLLGFDPRGIGASSPVQCESDLQTEALQLAACVDQNPLARTMGTSQAARDMELLRHLVGDERLNYLGYSYGTVLGATYSTLFPERLGRMVLDSALDARWGSLANQYDQNVAISRALVAMGEACAASATATACPYADEAGLGEIVNASLAEQPLIASGGFEVTGEGVYLYLVTALYGLTPDREHRLERVSAALGGEQGAIDEIADLVDSGGANVGAAGRIVSCHSFPDDPDVTGFVDHVHDVGLPALLGGPEIGEHELAAFMGLGCFALAERGDDITDSFSNRSGNPILVIGITGDHATPYAASASLVGQLGNARLLTLEGAGHTASFSDRSSCADTAVTAFLVRGELPEEGTVCTDD